MDSCLEAYNITDCLLQAIIDRFDDHNKFDVPTIAVTSIIGVIALFFAALAMLQGILAAAPGHRKCSRNAIGPWSKMNKRTWNWSEFRRESLAYTLIITTEFFILNGFRNLKVSPIRAGREKTRKYFPATWLHLLEGLKIDEQLYFYCKIRGEIAPYLADSLANDVQAVPARIDINVIVALAAAAGCYRMDLNKETGYPIITDRNSQIKFRPDLYFNVVSFFEHFSSTDHLRTVNLLEIFKLPGLDLESFVA